MSNDKMREAAKFARKTLQEALSYMQITGEGRGADCTNVIQAMIDLDCALQQSESEPAAEVFERTGEFGSYEEVVFHSDCPPGTKLYKCPQPSAQVPEGWRVEDEPEHSMMTVYAPDGKAAILRDFNGSVGGMFLRFVRALAPSIAEKREWVSMTDQEPENDSIVWTRWDGIQDAEGRAPVTGAAAKSLVPFVRNLQWLDTGLQRPEPPEPQT